MVTVACALAIGILLMKLTMVRTRDHSSIKIQKKLAYRDTLYVNRQMAFVRYETAVSDYANHTDNDNKQALQQSLHVLNTQLNATTQEYGLAVKRWIDLYKVWDFQFEKKLLASPKLGKSAAWDYTLLSYEQLIEKAVSQGDQSYKNNALNTLLYPIPFANHTASRSTMKRVEAMYQKKAKALIPAAIEKMKKTINPIALMSPRLDLKSPKNVAENIAFIQYSSRYAPFFVKTKSETLCANLRRTRAFDNSPNIDNALAVCEIAHQRLEKETKAAQKRYGHLRYATYFKEYVQPQIPTYKKILKTKSQSSNSRVVFNACDPSMQPVVNFRDPKIDAQVAAYEMYGYQYCHPYFKGNSGMYAQLQSSRTPAPIKNQNKKR